jgi:hypothetical protein
MIVFPFVCRLMIRRYPDPKGFGLPKFNFRHRCESFVPAETSGKMVLALSTVGTDREDA